MLVTVAGLPIANATLDEHQKLFTVSHTDSEYNSPFLGNGEVTTTVGPTGYHNGYCPEAEKVNRTIFWAGRRLSDARSADIRIPRVPPEELIGPTIPLVRFGRLLRSLKINGKETTDDNWTQRMDYNRGKVISTIEHGTVTEQTESLVCLTKNMLVFHTTFTNSSQKSHQLEFELAYQFGDAEGRLATGTRLHIRRPHPDDLGFGNVEGTRSLEQDLAKRPPHLRESLSVQYEIEKHLGEVHIGRYPMGIIRDTETGGVFTHSIELQQGESTELWFWLVLGDRLKYGHFPEYEQVLAFIEEHEQEWQNFWAASTIEISNPELEALRKSCLYTLRCNASPWTVPPGYLSTHWEGRTFHDEFYPFMGLISSNHADLAEHIPNYRLLTLPHARLRSAGRGTNFGWEVTETGEESAPYGHWVDEQFRHGQISEQAWRYYLYTKNFKDLERFYPVIKGCAGWMIHDVLIRAENGKLITRSIADVSEHVITAQNSIFAACATIRALENAARAAELLNIDEHMRVNWRNLASELRQNLPVDEKRNAYRYSDDVDIPTETAHLGMVFPFSIEKNSQRVKNTMHSAWGVYQNAKKNASSEQVFSYNWIWQVGRLATICFYQGLADKGYDVLNQAPKSITAFMAPNEHYHPDYGAFLPWLTSGAGAFVYAINAMFVQVIDEQGAVLLSAIPSKLEKAKFNGLLATHGVTVSGEIESGKPVKLTVHSKTKKRWSFRMKGEIANQVKFADGWTTSEPDSAGMITVSGNLKKGDNDLF
ncbi:hypothetical protein GF337_08390 [candidate division KSB1 bacterium]|nr:hypothetical protein [candidate division KSB1 bacterium]